MKENKWKKVLIALDYDPTAQKVAEKGFSMAKAMNAKVILLHVILDPKFYYSTEYSPIMGLGGNMDMNSSLLDTEEGLKKASQHFLDKTKLHLGDETIQTLVKEGHFADSILEAANEVKADIIVLGSHSHRWLEDILLGSVSESVIRDTDIPLFLIPTKHK
jgi:nucleotide-binding universal stress UspA family protein